MTAIELIDQMLSKEEFNCTKKQMEFLRKLVVESQDIKAMKWSHELYQKNVLASLKRDVTRAKNALQLAEYVLANEEKIVKDMK